MTDAQNATVLALLLKPFVLFVLLSFTGICALLLRRHLPEGPVKAFLMQPFKGGTWGVREGHLYATGANIVTALYAVAFWWYLISEYNVWLALLLGWIPALLAGIVVGALWPLQALVFFGLCVAKILGYF